MEGKGSRPSKNTSGEWAWLRRNHAHDNDCDGDEGGDFTTGTDDGDDEGGVALGVRKLALCLREGEGRGQGKGRVSYEGLTIVLLDSDVLLDLTPPPRPSPSHYQ